VCVCVCCCDSYLHAAFALTIFICSFFFFYFLDVCRDCWRSTRQMSFFKLCKYIKRCRFKI